MKLDIIAKNSEEKDEFYTPEYAIQPLLKYLTPKSRIWCPFDTKESNFVKMLKKEGHKVLHTHIGEFDNLSDRNRLDFFKLVEFLSFSRGWNILKGICSLRSMFLSPTPIKSTLFPLSSLVQSFNNCHSSGLL